MNEQALIPYTAQPVPKAGTVLVLAPHADDEVFGCGGVLALHRRQGDQVVVIILTDGAQAGDQTTRLAESQQAALVLGYDTPLCWGLPDRGLRYGEALVETILAAVEENNATLVYAPSLWENHPDHRATAIAVIEALRRQGRATLMQYETSAPLRPNFLVDISAVREQKKAAMACFTSQLARQRYDRQVDGLNTFRTFTLPAAVEAAEAFEHYTPEDLRQGALSFLRSEYQRQHDAGLIALPDDLPLVSIIIRSMDRPTLHDALNSVALQTWPHLEVVVVNAKGGLHASLPEHCGPFPLRLINREGEPLSRPVAANRGLQEARGRYIGFLDDDDTLDPDHIYALVAALQTKLPDVVVYSGVKGLRRHDNARTVLKTFNESTVHFPKLLLGNVIPIHAVLFPASLLKKGVRFDETLTCYEDWDFWLQASRIAPFHFVDRITATYYLGGDSAVSPLAPDADTVAHAAEDLFRKWLHLLTPTEWKAVADLHHQTVYDLQACLDYHNRRLTETEGRLTETEGRLTETEGRLTETEGRLTETEGRLTETEGRLAETEGRLTETEGRLTEQLNQSRDAQAMRQAELEAMYASRSWRMTRPVRWAGRLAREMRHYLLETLHHAYRRLPLSPSRKAILRGWYYRNSLPGLHPAAYEHPTNPMATASQVTPFTRRAMDEAPVRILLLERSVPRPNQDAGSVMIFNFIRIFRERGYALTFFPADLAYDPDYTPALQAMGVQCLHIPMVHSLYEHLVVEGASYDLILSCRPDLTAAMLPLLRTHCPQARLLYETHDLHYVREERQAALEQREPQREELFAHARWRKEQELGIAAAVDCTIVVSEQERNTLLAENPRLYVEVIPVVSESFACEAGFGERSGLIFIGGYEHQPNVDAVIYFVREIMPLITAQDPNLIFHVVGSNPPPELIALTSNCLVIHGFVPDLTELMHKVRISVNPLRFGAGVKGKLVTSMSYGVPCIGTSIAVEGMGAVPGQQVLVADTPRSFADAVLTLHHDQNLWERLSRGGRELAHRKFSLDAAAQGFERIFKNMLPNPPRNGLYLERLASQDAYQHPDRTLLRQYYHETETNLASANEPIVTHGFCFVCGGEMSFHSDLKYGFPQPDGSIVPNWRERVVCPECHLNNRMRAAIHLFHLLGAPTPESRIYLTEQTTTLFAWFQRNYAQVIGSEYLGDTVPPGGVDHTGLRNENLTALSFANECLDTILSFDVIEHIPNYRQAFQECLRCLKPGGTLFFTVPFDHRAANHTIRAKLDETGQIHHLLPPEYHGDPLNNDGCLCFYHFGWKLLDELRELGFRDVVAYGYWSEHFGYLGGEQLLFRALK